MFVGQLGSPGFSKPRAKAGPVGRDSSLNPVDLHQAAIFTNFSASSWTKIKEPRCLRGGPRDPERHDVWDPLPLVGCLCWAISLCFSFRNPPAHCGRKFLLELLLADVVPDQLFRKTRKEFPKWFSQNPNTHTYIHWGCRAVNVGILIYIIYSIHGVSGMSGSSQQCFVLRCRAFTSKEQMNTLASSKSCQGDLRSLERYQDCCHFFFKGPLHLFTDPCACLPTNAHVCTGCLMFLLLGLRTMFLFTHT